MQTAKGYDRLGTVKEMSKEPRSYIVQADGKTYRRNNRHILPVTEPPSPQLLDDLKPSGHQPPYSGQFSPTTNTSITHGATTTPILSPAPVHNALTHCESRHTIHHIYIYSEGRLIPSIQRV